MCFNIIWAFLKMGDAQNHGNQVLKGLILDHLGHPHDKTDTSISLFTIINHYESLLFTILNHYIPWESHYPPLLLSFHYEPLLTIIIPLSTIIIPL